jgi:hypothetical protein
MAISAVKAAWKKGTGVPVDPDPPGPGGGLYTVVGTQIKDPSGATFYPFGANTAVKMTRYNYAFEWEPGSTDTISGFSPPGEPGLFLPHIREASEWGWNFLRINTVPWNDSAGGPTPGGNPTSIMDQLKPGIDQLLAAGFVVMVTSHYPSPGVNPQWGSVDELRNREFWTRCLFHYKDHPRLWINPFNEPHGGGGASAVNNLVVLYTNYISFLRGQGYKNPLVFDIARYAQGIDDVAIGLWDSFMTLDPNLILSWHAYGVNTGENSVLGYPAWDVTKASANGLATAAHNRGHCIIIGEFGRSYNGTTVTGSVAGQDNVVEWACVDRDAEVLDMGLVAWHAGHGVYSLIAEAVGGGWSRGPFWSYNGTSPNFPTTNQPRSVWGVQYWDQGQSLGVGIDYP